jgi:CRP-like cAMP-binding protein
MTYGLNSQYISDEASVEQSTPTQFMTASRGMLIRSPFTFPMANRLLASLPQVELNTLRPHFTRARLVAKQVLIERGRPSEHAFFIEEGLASIVAETEHGEPGVQVAMVGREGMVGALALLNDKSATCGSGIMQIAGSALRIPITQLRHCLDDCPVLRDISMGFVQSLTRQLMSVAARNIRCTLIERYVYWLLMAHERIDGDELPVTQEALSILLGVRRSGVTVATTSLQKAGLISTSRGRIRILDRHGLNALVSSRSRDDRVGSLDGPVVAQTHTFDGHDAQSIAPRHQEINEENDPS